MSVFTKRPRILFLLSMLAASASGSVSAQQATPDADLHATMPASPPPASPPPASPPSAAPAHIGPEIKGIISARSGDRMQVTAVDGTKTIIAIDDSTRITASKGFLGLDHSKLAAGQLLNGLPVTVKTLQSDDALVASQITLRNNDLKTATMIRTGTAQGFDEQTAATEALRGRMGDIDQYNIKGTTNVNFDTGKAALSEAAKADLCAAASQAEGTKNALLLVVGYTDSTGSDDFNQRLSEKRASSVVNYVQQACHWKPYRMLTPTGMAKADPLASNDSVDGKAQNRRVAVNILVSKGLDGL
jgi:outer membrane protein OmpA-like peptidoglycan-associated protein